MVKNKELKKGKITGIGSGILLIIVLVIFFSIVNSTTQTSNKVEVNNILNVNDFYKTANQTISIEELIKMYGNPESKEEWNYTKSDGTKISITTLYYNNSTYEYSFNNNMLIRITINEKIKYNSIEDMFTLFGLQKHDSTQINNTNSAIRIYNSSVSDFWCQITDKTITCTKITFIDGIF